MGGFLCGWDSWKLRNGEKWGKNSGKNGYFLYKAVQENTTEYRKINFRTQIRTQIQGKTERENYEIADAISQKASSERRLSSGSICA